MSSASIAESAGGVLAAWESYGQVYHGRIDPATASVSEPVPAPGAGGNRKHPAVARNTEGETLLVWTEGTGWQKGGALAWQLFDRSGQPAGERGRIEDGVPTWGLAAVVARPDAGFTIFH
jgi:hypothetical protein